MNIKTLVLPLFSACLSMFAMADNVDPARVELGGSAVIQHGAPVAKTPESSAQDSILQHLQLSNLPGASVFTQSQRLIEEAYGLLGLRYRYGGTSPTTGMDCSGLVQYVFRQALNISLPRTAAEQSRVGKPIAITDLQAGDLVFFNTMRRSFSHVGIYIGAGQFIHAPRSGKRIQITSLSNSYFNARFQGARRIISEEEN